VTADTTEAELDKLCGRLEVPVERAGKGQHRAGDVRTVGRSERQPHSTGTSGRGVTARRQHR